MQTHYTKSIYFITNVDIIKDHKSITALFSRYYICFLIIVRIKKIRLVNKKCIGLWYSLPEPHSLPLLLDRLDAINNISPMGRFIQVCLYFKGSTQMESGF